MKHFLTLLLLTCLCSFGQTTGQFYYQTKAATGHTPHYLTPIEGRVPVWISGVLGNLDIAGTYAPKATPAFTGVAEFEDIVAANAIACPYFEGAVNYYNFVGASGDRMVTLPDDDVTLLYAGGPLGTPSGGTISGSFVTGGTFGAVNGSALTALNGSNISSGTITNIPITGSTGSFTSLASSGNLTFSDTGEGIALHGGGTVTGASGAITATASGTNQNITLTPSGTGIVYSPGNELKIGSTGNGNFRAVRAGSTDYIQMQNAGFQIQVSNTNAITVIGSGGLTYGNAVSLGSTLAVTGASTLNGGVILPTSTTPASASAAGVAGTICRDADYIYVCTATNTWKRVAIATW